MLSICFIYIYMKMRNVLFRKCCNAMIWYFKMIVLKIDL